MSEQQEKTIQNLRDELARVTRQRDDRQAVIDELGLEVARMTKAMLEAAKTGNAMLMKDRACDGLTHLGDLLGDWISVESARRAIDVHLKRGQLDSHEMKG